jgi:hypothetical protein
MKLDAANIARILRGIIGIILISAGIIDNNWIWVPGAMLMFSAATGRCGFGSNSCEVKPVTVKGEKNNE